VKAGQNLTVITYGAVVQKMLQAAAQLEQRYPDKTIEVIDLRSLSPYDWEAVSATVCKTHRVIVAYEDMLSWGYGAEIAARIADELFDELDAPVKRVAAMDTFCAYQPKLEDVILPQTDHITAAVKTLLEY
jgi:2-oxoisovalerate dehydrogenase E1 component